MDWSELFYKFLPWIIREIIIVFGTLGIVYTFGRLLFPGLNKKSARADKIKNRIAAVSLLVITCGSGLVYDYPTLFTTGLERVAWVQYGWDSLLYFSIGVVFYVTVGWRFFKRIDSYLDKKIGPDTKEKK